MLISVQEKNKLIYDTLSKTVRGHDKAKKVLINMVNRSKCHYMQKAHLGIPEKDRVHIGNCLLIGESGTGKTYLVESLAKLMNFPYVKIDATEFNPTGASGGVKKTDLVDMIWKRAKWYNENFPKSYFSADCALDQMIVFVDEIDKLGERVSSEWNQHVQANFLTLFENKDRLNSITYIFAGAFSKMQRNRTQSRPMGFNTKIEDEPLEDLDLTQEVIKYGLLPELVGRFNNIVALDKLTKEDYLSILKDCVIPKVEDTLTALGILGFSMTDSDVERVINHAMKSGLGVRSLYTEVNKLTIDLEFNCGKV